MLKTVIERIYIGKNINIHTGNSWDISQHSHPHILYTDNEFNALICSLLWDRQRPCSIFTEAHKRFSFQNYEDRKDFGFWSPHTHAKHILTHTNTESHTLTHTYTY